MSKDILKITVRRKLFGPIRPTAGSEKQDNDSKKEKDSSKKKKK